MMLDKNLLQVNKWQSRIKWDFYKATYSIIKMCTIGMYKMQEQLWPKENSSINQPFTISLKILMDT